LNQFGNRKNERGIDGKKKFLTVCALVVVFSSVSAFAAVYSQVQTFAGIPNINNTFTFNQFDSSLGTLTGIEITLTVNSNGGQSYLTTTALRQLPARLNSARWAAYLQAM
jgi:opacity protein-like surface antigen